MPGPSYEDLARDWGAEPPGGMGNPSPAGPGYPGGLWIVLDESPPPPPNVDAQPTPETPPPPVEPIPRREEGAPPPNVPPEVDPRNEPPPEFYLGEDSRFHPIPPPPPGGWWTTFRTRDRRDVRPVPPPLTEPDYYDWISDRPDHEGVSEPIINYRGGGGPLDGPRDWIVDPQVQRRPGTIFGPPPIDTPGQFPMPGGTSSGSQTPRPSLEELRRGAAERDRMIREAAEAAMRDSRIRSGAAVVIEGIARAVIRSLPVPVLRAGREILSPGELGTGTISTEEAIMRGLPTIPEPVITQPPPLPLPSPPQPEMTPPWPSQQSRPTSTPAPVPLPSPTPVPIPSPRPLPVPNATGVLSGLWTSVIRQRTTSSWPWRQPFTDPLTQAFADSARVYGSSTPSTTKQPGAGTFPGTGTATNPLTGSNTATLSWSPPRTPTRTRTRTDECNCRPKKRKKARDCNVRGNLMWTSGPKKGKPAGSRCVNFKGTK